MEPPPPTMTTTTRKERPSVLITTYSSERHNSAAIPQSNQHQGPEQEQQEHRQHQSQKLDRSTDLFGGKSRSHLAGKPSSKGALVEFYQIRGPNGSVRGHKDVVRKSLQNIRVVASGGQRNFNSAILPTFMGAKWASRTKSECSEGERASAHNSSSSHFIIQRLDEQNRSDYLASLIEHEQNQCVAYITTLGVIRRTFEDSRLMKTILNLNLIKYEQRDIYLNQEYKHQLWLRCESITVPALFVDGQFLGGIKELELMNETGKLSKLLAKFKMSSDLAREVCACCGDAKFIACQSCNGSRKSTIRHFKFSSIALRCIKCDKNDGLVQCPTCCCLPTEASDATNFDFNNNESSERSRYLEDKEKETVVASCESGDEELKQLEKL